MSERAGGGESGSGFSFNLNTVLAVLVVIAGAFLVSKPLSSQRPATGTPGTSLQTLGEQSIDARLWEDPFASFQNRHVQETNLIDNFSALSRSVRERLKQNPQAIQIVPVCIPGGPYSEDRESRIRSRFAVISALGTAGYAPRDAEHLGIAATPWPTTAEIESPLQEPLDRSPQFTFAATPNPKLMPISFVGMSAASSTNAGASEPGKQGKERPRPPTTNFAVITNADTAGGGVVASSGLRLRLAFEWFRLRTFAPKASSEKTTNVLVIWVDDDLFQDHPLERMSLLIAAVLEGEKTNLPPVSVIGPRRSSTLRAMVAGDYFAKPKLWEGAEPEFLNGYKNTLTQIRFFSGTASAMDEVMVGSTNELPPRAVIAKQLESLGVTFRNFTCTDAQLATNALGELARRGVSFTNMNNQLVLIGEWDTFYGRMVALTYAAEIAHLQNTNVSRHSFIEKFRHGERVWPANLTVLNYLRGLDGQTFEKPNRDEEGAQPSRKRAPKDLADLAMWTPDVNKAEGPAQLDYLARLADRIEEVERESRGKSKYPAVRAIGVNGSDVYDTLLILQALRRRFPNAVFFTTDLDARLWNPREFSWTRGLVVSSSYGLQLGPEYQKTISPFRDSAQTAQYAATLGALNVLPPERIPTLLPRTFEIARGGAIDLTEAEGQTIHPVAWPRRKPALFLVFASLVVGLALAVVLIRPLRNMLRARLLTATLWVREEDIGDVEDFLRRLDGSDDEIARELRDKLEAWDQQQTSDRNVRELARRLGGARGEAKRRKEHQQLTTAMLDFLNERLNDDWWVPADVLRKSSLIPEERKKHLSGTRKWLRESIHLVRVAKNRREFDMFVDAISFAIVHDDGARAATFVQRLATSRDPLAQWVCRQAGQMAGGLTMGNVHAVVNAGIFEYPWAPKREILASVHISQKTKENYCKWYVHFLRRLGLLSKPATLSNRTEVDEFFQSLIGPSAAAPAQISAAPEFCELEAAASARKASRLTFWQMGMRILAMFLIFAALASCLIPMARQAWFETWDSPVGEPFSLSSGVSAWPTEFLRLIAIALSACFLIDSYCSLRIGTAQVARRFRLNFSEGSRAWHIFFTRGPLDRSRVSASWVWTKYQQMGGFWKRFRRALILATLYFGFGYILMRIEGFPVAPVRGTFLTMLDLPLVIFTVWVFLFLTFWTMDAVRLCRWFIEHLSLAPTDYPKPTSRHFKAQHGGIDEELLDEWIDTQLIAELTERVGRLVYYPSIIFLIFLLARHSWWDGWTWPWSLIAISVLNLVFAVSSVFILQRAAIKARERGMAALDAKLKTLRRMKAPSKPQANFDLGQGLLEELRTLKRGAFVPIWSSPALGALLVPSGGVALIELMTYMWGR